MVTSDNNVLLSKRRNLTKGYEIVSGLNFARSGFDSRSKALTLFHTLYRKVQFQFLPHYFGQAPQWRRALRRLDKDRTLPDFCVIGAIKSGTSDLSVNVLMHPNVMTPLSKEIDDIAPETWREFYPTMREKQRHARRHGLALAPYMTPYLHHTGVMRNLAAACPGIKVVLVLRDPVKRMYSHWKWDVLLAGKKRTEQTCLKTFPAYVDEALQAYGAYPMDSTCGFDPITTSVYAHAVAGWFASVGRDNVLVIDAASYYRDRNACLKRIQQFVGLPDYEVGANLPAVLENPLDLPSLDAGSIERLSAFFKVHNEQLWALIGERFDWL